MASAHVGNISPKTTDEEIRHFFSLCGKIENLKVTPEKSSSGEETKSATVTFADPAAVKTALLLDKTELGSNHISVTGGEHKDAEKSTAEGTSSTSSGAADPSSSTSTNALTTAHQGDELRQEDKPRSRILAELLAHGYLISDRMIEHGLALDKQYGISDRFKQILTNFVQKLNASDRAKAIDEKYALRDKTNAGIKDLQTYFEKALDTPTGQKLKKLYEDGNAKVADVRSEARYLADHAKQKQQEAHGTQAASHATPSDATAPTATTATTHDASATKPHEASAPHPSDATTHQETGTVPATASDATKPKPTTPNA